MAYAPPMTVAPDRDLMVSWQRGDTAAFEALYRRHGGPLYRYLLRTSGSEDVASEVFQEAWFRVVDRRDRYRPEGAFTAWLYRVARNCLIDYHRRRASRPPSSANMAHPPETDVPASSDVPSELEHSERLAAVRRGIAELPADQRDAFLLAHEAGLTLEEIAHVTGVGRETVKSRIRYAMDKLRRALRTLEPDEPPEDPRT